MLKLSTDQGDNQIPDTIDEEIEQVRVALMYDIETVVNAVCGVTETFNTDERLCNYGDEQYGNIFNI